MSSKLFATRQGTILLGVIAAVIAAIALIVYLKQYRDSVNNNTQTSVLVAKSRILTGTPGGVVGSTGLYEFKDVSKSTLNTPAFKGAFLDPSALAGKVAVTDIYPGQALTASDFGAATGTLAEQLEPDQRAVVIPLGSPQQVGGQIGGGSHVDVWITRGDGSVKLLFQDVYVLGTNGDNVTLRTSPRQAGQMIYASLHAQMWFDVRPTVAKNAPQTSVNGLGG